MTRKSLEKQSKSLRKTLVFVIASAASVAAGISVHLSKQTALVEVATFEGVVLATKAEEHSEKHIS